MRGEVVINQSPESSERALENLRQKTRKVLLAITTFFPFDLFPDKVVIDITKVEIIYREFFFHKTIFPILIKDLKNVVVTTDFFFGSLTFEITGFEENPPKVIKLRRADALKAHQLISGLITAQEQGVDLINLNPDQIYTQLMSLGSTPATS